MRTLGVIAMVVALAAGCHLTPQDAARDVCDAYCKCIAPDLPGAQTSCIEKQCLPEVPTATDECLQCVFDHDRTCGDLIATCTNMCIQNATPLLGGM